MAEPSANKSRFACTPAGEGAHDEALCEPHCGCEPASRLAGGETPPEPEFAPGSIEALLFGPNGA